MKYKIVYFIFLNFIYFNTCFACKPCDGNPVGHSIKFSSLVVTGKAISKVSSKKGHSIYEIEIKETIKGKAPSSIILVNDRAQLPCHTKLFDPVLHQKKLFFIKEENKNLSFLSYCGKPGLVLDSENQLLLSEEDAKGLGISERKLPLYKFIKEYFP